jgi:crossover junction endodeoxyribonuclease RuvC
LGLILSKPKHKYALSAVKKERIILGIDPGTVIMGYGVIKIIGSEVSLVELGHLDMKKLANHELKLKRIFERTLSLIDQHLPDEMALEAPFFGKNVQSMLKLGRAQGVAMAAALSREIPIVEYAPKKVKQSVTGNGNASKEQVAALLKNMFKFDDFELLLDATDGLAVALCHFYQKGQVPVIVKKKAGGKKVDAWSAFVKEKPNRVIK